MHDGLGYFEVAVSASSVGLTYGHGYEGRRANRGIHIGWRPIAYGYHSDDGSKWRHDSRARPTALGDITQGERFAEPFGNNAGAPDVIGCGLDLTRRSVFFTKNGRLCGTAFEEVEACVGHSPQPTTPGLRPTVTLHRAGDECVFNFGSRPFVFDLLAYGRSDARHAPVVGGGPMPVEVS